MLDAKIVSQSLFSINMASKSVSDCETLVLSGCKVTLAPDIPYSEMEELNYYYLNNNDYGCGRMKIELSFDNNFKNPYFDFHIQCVSIGADNKVICKINRNPANENTYTKITKYNKLAFGIGYYFKSLEERDNILNCKSFCMEGFVSLKGKRNVYGFMCNVQQIDNDWNLCDGNTYKKHKKINIQSLYH